MKGCQEALRSIEAALRAEICRIYPEGLGIIHEKAAILKDDIAPQDQSVFDINKTSPSQGATINITPVAVSDAGLRVLQITAEVRADNLSASITIQAVAAPDSQHWVFRDFMVINPGNEDALIAWAKAVAQSSQ